MRSVKSAVWALSLVGLLLVISNLWTAGARSTILSALNGKVTHKETRFEKHKGKDDVYLIWLDEICHQVDLAVYDSVQIGQRVEKQPLSSTLAVERTEVNLSYSRDTRGMLPAMALVMIILVTTGWYSCKLAGIVSIVENAG